MGGKHGVAVAVEAVRDEHPVAVGGGAGDLLEAQDLEIRLEELSRRYKRTHIVALSVNPNLPQHLSM